MTSRQPAAQTARPCPVGDPTEVALLLAAEQVGLDPERLALWPRVAELAFDSVRKRMTTIHQLEDRVVACTKGAWSEVSRCCAFAETLQGLVAVTTELRPHLNDRHDALARTGYRVLAVARRDFPADIAPPYRAEAVERDLVFLGFVALEDQPRPEVPPAVAACRRAGIRVCMVTGDDPLTATAIARQIGLHDVEPLVVTGNELDHYRAAALEHLLVAHRDVLFARTAPQHKSRLVEAFQHLGEVVAVTGDGVNDAPALRGAEIGLAMGATGTDVAREAADMILTDDNFAAIVSAIEYGRAVFDNVRKFVTYISASNIPEIVPFLLFVPGGLPLPLPVAQILAVDLGTDLFPALALGREPAARRDGAPAPLARGADFVLANLAPRLRLARSDSSCPQHAGLFLRLLVGRLAARVGPERLCEDVHCGNDDDLRRNRGVPGGQRVRLPQRHRHGVAARLDQQSHSLGRHRSGNSLLHGVRVCPPGGPHVRLCAFDVATLAVRCVVPLCHARA
ncbi:MAG: HAD-IC family P-type ATPase [Candidatus Binatia bacterium]|nr:HAD-IC family P-type ATPase [Candidatus Binatia bacterium]